MKNVRNLLNNKLFIIISNFFLLHQSFCQNWTEVGGGVTGITHDVNVFYSDSVNNVLYLGGGFTHAGNINANRIVSWNGAQWSALGNGAGVPQVFAIGMFHDTIYASGDFFYNYYASHIAKWDGINWDTLRNGIMIPPSAISTIDDTLYVGGAFNIVDSMQARLLAKWDGIHWSPYNFPFNQGSVKKIIKYQGNIYLGGNFYDTISFQLHDFAMLNGNQLNQVGPLNYSPAGYTVYDMIEYKGELYISGYFNSALGNNILKWDGTNYKSLGGADDGVLGMTVYNNELFVVGAFQQIGGINAKLIARWDGMNWHNVGNDVFDNGIIALTVYNGELYIGGAFTTINGIPARGIAKYTGPPLSASAINDNKSIEIFPNPIKNELNFKSFAEINKLTISDITGNEIILIIKPDARVDLTHLNPGIYFIAFYTSEGRIIKNIIKE